MGNIIVAAKPGISPWFIGQVREASLKKRENCWEYFKCGREPGGVKCEELGICTVAAAAESDGINHGRAAGRSCWTIMDSKSAEERADKFCNCMSCSFFNKVIAEEGRAFELGINRDLPKKQPGLRRNACGNPA